MNNSLCCTGAHKDPESPLLSFISIYMGNVEIPTQGAGVYKSPLSNYEFGANVVKGKVSFDLMLD